MFSNLCGTQIFKIMCIYVKLDFRYFVCFFVSSSFFYNKVGKGQLLHQASKFPKLFWGVLAAPAEGIDLTGIRVLFFQLPSWVFV